MADSFRCRLPLPLAVALVVFLLAAVVATGLVWRLEQTDRASLRVHAAQEAANHANTLERNIERALSTTFTLAMLIEQGKGVLPDFDAIATRMLPLYPEVSSLQLAPRGIVQSIVPLADNEKAIGHDLLKDPTRTKAAFAARDTGKLTLDGPFDLVQGGVGAVGRLPVFLNDDAGRPAFWGFAIVLISFPEVIQTAHFAGLAEQGFAWELWRADPDTQRKRVIAAFSPFALIDPVTNALDVPNATWTLSVAPIEGWHNPSRLSTRLTLGLLFSLLLAYAAKLLMESKIHAKGLETLVAQRTAEILANEAELNRAQSMARIGSWTFDLAKNEFRGSAELARIYRANAGTPLSYDLFLQGVHAQDRETVDKAWQVALKGGAPYDIQYRIVAGAETRWVHSRAKMSFDADGTLRQAIGTSQDVTDRKQREEELLRFRMAMDSTADAIYLVDRASMRFIDINVAACAMRGQSREEILALGPVGVLPASRTELERAYDAVIAGDNTATASVEMLRKRKDGRRVWVELQRSARRFGEDWMIITVVRDITESKRSSEALAESEARFRGLVEQSIAGIYLIQDDKFAYVNPRFAEIFGCASAGELIGRESLSIVIEKDRGVVLGMRRRVEGGVLSMSYTFTGVRKDGVEIEVGVHSSRATHNGRSAVIGLAQDISEKKRAEEQIQHYVAQLENAFMSTVEVATTLGEMRDPYTAGHQRRVAEIAVAVGAELGFDARRQEGLRVAGYLHDLGKIRVPSEILSRPGKLKSTEFQLVQGHAQAGYDVLKGVEFPWPVAEVALQHHERVDGSGYPQGLKGEAILIESRIVAVADVIEAMSSHRPYRPALGIDRALAEIERGRGSAYDAEVVDACLRLFREKQFELPV
jgi:PAS domain S-box-containing protein